VARVPVWAAATSTTNRLSGGAGFLARPVFDAGATIVHRGRVENPPPIFMGICSSMDCGECVQAYKEETVGELIWGQSPSQAWSEPERGTVILRLID
jgi:hypothetical protein